jgi:peptidoglycan pentaglycine glycine transferase (the first glycine)
MSVSPFRIEIDKVDRESWDKLITQFHDASLSQVWSSGNSVVRKRSASHIVLKAGQEILGCCQVELRRLHFSKIGLADVHWGPLYMRKGKEVSSEVLKHLVRGIKDEYAIKRGYLVRIWPHVKRDQKVVFKQILKDTGFHRSLSERPYRTFILDLSPSIEDLRKNLSPNWRRNLNKAERGDLRVVEGTSDDLFKIFVMFSKEMWKRKNLATSIDYQEYRRIQEDLPEPLKMNIMICYAGNEPVCAVIGSAIGDTGIYLLGATGEKSLKLNSSYLLHWCMIQWMKERGVAYYDLGAHNPQLNPGGYQFKLGIAGKKGWDETFLGEYHGYFNWSGRIVEFLLDCSKFLRGISNNWK